MTFDPPPHPPPALFALPLACPSSLKLFGLWSQSSRSIETAERSFNSIHGRGHVFCFYIFHFCYYDPKPSLPTPPQPLLPTTSPLFLSLTLKVIRRQPQSCHVSPLSTRDSVPPRHVRVIRLPALLIYPSRALGHGIQCPQRSAFYKTRTWSWVGCM